MCDTATEAASRHETATATIDFTVEGTTCGSCAARIQRLLSKQPGVADAEVNFATGKAHVALEGEGTDLEVLTAGVERIGYGLKQLDAHAPTTPLGVRRRRRGGRAPTLAAASVALLAAGLGLSLLSPMLPLGLSDEPWTGWASLALTVPVQFFDEAQVSRQALLKAVEAQG